MSNHAAPLVDADLLTQAQRYLAHRKNGQLPSRELEAAWCAFYDHYLRKIRNYAFSIGATEADIADCVQEVWTELLVRLPAFRLDPERGKFDTWLFHIVRSKAIDLHRFCKRRGQQEGASPLQSICDPHPSPVRTLEEAEMVALAWGRVRKTLSECNFQVLQMRLVDQRPVAEVAEALGLSHEQVWKRYHRARSEAEKIGSAVNGRQHPHSDGQSICEEMENFQKSVEGNDASTVSRIVDTDSHTPRGGNGVDYVFQRLELGRRELSPEWKVEWEVDGEPRAVLYMRKMAIVAFAEICGPEEFVSSNWPRIVNAAIAAGVAAGIATIIATPSGALGVFRAEFQKQLQAKGRINVDEKLQVALSATQDANGPWCVCRQ